MLHTTMQPARMSEHVATVDEALQIAVAHHQRGQLHEAGTIYRQILEANPAHADALHLLGLVAHQFGQPARAVELIGQAIAIRPGDASFYCNLGEALRALGRVQEAERALREAIRLNPDMSQALNNLGNLLRLLGQREEAARHLKRALELEPLADTYYNLGLLLAAEGEIDEAVQQFRRAVEMKWNFADAWNNLGRALQARGDEAEAMRCYEQTLRLMPQSAEAHFNLATSYEGLQQLETAISHYRRALDIKPDFTQAHTEWCAALKAAGRSSEALAASRADAAARPDSAAAQFHLATALSSSGDEQAALAVTEVVARLAPDWQLAPLQRGYLLQQLGREDEALACFERAIELNPAKPAGHLHRGNVLWAKKMHREAAASYEQALRLQPNYPEAYNGLTMVYTDMAQPDIAIEHGLRGLRQRPKSGPLHANLAIALAYLGRGEESIAHARKAIELRPDDAAAHSNLIYGLNFISSYDAPTIFAEHLAWGARHAEPLTRIAAPHTNDRSLERRLKIGYSSAYFRSHAVNFFTEPILLAHDHEAFEIVCYSDVRATDAVTERLRAAADGWRDVRAWSDARLAEQIRQDEIDILVDLTGHIGHNRMCVFARKPAPVQVTYIGYQNTTGMSAMDYRLTDERADPPGTNDEYYTEKLVRLPRSFFCYKPPEESPDIMPLPAATAGHVTFGTFNNMRKITPRVIEVWMEILARVPNSRLIVSAYQTGYVPKYFASVANAHRVDPARIIMFDKLPRGDYLRLVAQADIALDPFPFTGHTTTCDSLWMGVPVVMLEGRMYASRFGGSALVNVGLADLITQSVEQYIRRAVELAGDLPRLIELKRELRPRMAASALLDFAGFTRNLENEYREMWRTWCRTAP